MAHSIASSTDSIDGYDSFENTNNKKKRKIPLSGGLAAHAPSLSASLSNDLANMGLTNSRESDDLLDDGEDGIGHYHRGSSPAVASVSGTGISGAGRGRFGRNGRRETMGRGPLTVSGSAGNLTGGRAGLAYSGMHGMAFFWLRGRWLIKNCRASHQGAGYHLRCHRGGCHESSHTIKRTGKHQSPGAVPTESLRRGQYAIHIHL